MSRTCTMIGVGIDTARYGHHVTLLREDLDLAAEPFDVLESAVGYAKLHEALQRLDERYHGPRFQIRVDAAGQYAANLLRFLEGLPFDKQISVGEPKRNKDYRNVHFPKRKADAVESHACARFAVVERPRPMQPVPEEFLQLREIISALQSATKQSTRLINQLHNRLSRTFPELATLVKDLSAKWVLNLLVKYPTAEKIAAARLSSIANIPYVRKPMAKALHEAAKSSSASLAGELIEEMIKQQARELLQSKATERKLEQLLDRAFDALPGDRHRQLLSIDGIGKLTAAALVGTMVSIDRFETPDSVVNFYGVFPEESTSGFTRNGQRMLPGTQRMCQKGNDLVRKLLYMSCLSALKNNPAIRALYARKRAEGKRADVALGHCMRKMLHLVHAVWRSGKPFDRNHYPWGGPDRRDADGANSQEKAIAETGDSSEQEPVAEKKRYSGCFVDGTPAPQADEFLDSTNSQISINDRAGVIAPINTGASSLSVRASEAPPPSGSESRGPGSRS